MKILNAFSLQMFPPLDGKVAVPSIKEIDLKTAINLFEGGVDSAVGHADTAAVLSDILGIEVQCIRKNILLQHGDEAVVAQLTGGRLPEGSKTLPKGYEIKFFLVRVRYLDKDLKEIISTALIGMDALGKNEYLEKISESL